MKSLGQAMAEVPAIRDLAAELRTRAPSMPPDVSDWDGFQSRHGWISGEELRVPGVKKLANHAGQRDWVWPLCWMDGEPVYPPVHLPPGEERREVERAILARYEAYRKRKQR